MIRRSPAEYYIKYLMLLPSELSDEDIKTTLLDNQLDYPGAKYLKQLRVALRPPPVFRPMIETDLPSYRFLHSHKVHKLFFRDEYIQNALAILETPRAKEMVEAMTMVEDSAMRICSRLERVSVKATPKAIEYYQHFFWNIRLVEPAELRALLELRVEYMLLDTPDAEALLQYKAMKQAMYNDSRFVVATSSSPAVAAMRLQMRHGLMPNRVEYSRLAEAARAAALMSLTDVLMRNGPKTAVDARDLSVVVANLTNVLVDQGTPDQDLRKAMRDVALGTDQSKVPTLAALTGGGYTESVQLSKGAVNDK